MKDLEQKREKPARTPRQKTLLEGLEQRLEQYLSKWRPAIERRFARQFAQIEEETKERSASNEVALFAHPMIRFCVFISSIAVFITILHYTAPPVPIKQALADHNVVFVPDANLCFGYGCLDDPKRNHKVQLPFFDLKIFRDYQDHDLYYQFNPKLSDENKRKGLDTLLIPILWGDGEVFVDNKLISDGPNYWPLVPISGGETIRVHFRSPSGEKFGIRGLMPPFITDRFFARSFEKDVNGQPFQFQYSFVAQLAGFCLLLIMFLTFPYRPELFSFLVLFALETIRAYLFLVRDRGETIFSPKLDEITYNALLICAAVALVFFIGTFFRRTLRSICRFFLKNLVTLTVGLTVGYFTLTSYSPSLPGEDALFISVWVAATISSILLVRDTILFLSKPGSKLRLTIGLSALAGALYWAALNIRDHLTLTSAITTEYNNHLHFFFFMSTVLGIEVGRTEIKIREAFSLLPKEVVRFIHDPRECWREGFVVLVDVVGWSKVLRTLPESETPSYMRGVNEYLLSVLDEPKASVVTGTGDGFFMTFEGDPSEERFNKLIRACSLLAQRRPTLESIGVGIENIRNERIIVRSAIGYGRYYIGFVQTKNLKKEFLAGFLATALARAIGNEKNPSSVRVLSGSILDRYRNNEQVETQVTKDEKIEYWNVAA
ncbi:MAG: hypothetical protein P4M08_03910 [Oligoflexia bacterium]|nr:hypothetical protein [Oligoflexia bacterium]